MAAPLTPLEKIESLVTWYQDISEKFSDGAHLINARRKLSTSVFQFAEDCVLAGKERSQCEWKRKSELAKAVKAHMADGKSAAAAKALADADTEALLGEELRSDAEYRGMGRIYEAAIEVLSCMNQHIANLRQERELETRGQGSQSH